MAETLTLYQTDLLPPPISGHEPENALEDVLRRNAVRHRELREGIRTTEPAIKQLNEHREKLLDLDKAVTVSERKLYRLRVDKANSVSETASWKNSSFKKFAYSATGQSNKFQQRAAKEEQAYSDTLKEEETERELFQALKQQVKAAKHKEQELEKTVYLNYRLHEALDALYGSIFSSQFPQSREEARALKAIDTATQEYHVFDQIVRSETDAVNLLLKAQADLQSALEIFITLRSGALKSTTEDKKLLSKADALINIACNSLKKARASSRYLRSMHEIPINVGKIIAPVFFESMHVDMARHHNIGRAHYEVKCILQQLEPQCKAANTRIEELERAFDEKETRLEWAKNALEQFRVEAFDKATRGDRIDIYTNSVFALEGNDAVAEGLPPPYEP